jgi:aromatic ring-cleaving dioxygenase
MPAFCGQKRWHAVVAWLMLNRNSLTVLLRPETGHDLRDHGVHAVWFGAVLPLQLCGFLTTGQNSLTGPPAKALQK